MWGKSSTFSLYNLNITFLIFLFCHILTPTIFWIMNYKRPSYGLFADLRPRASTWATPYLFVSVGRRPVVLISCQFFAAEWPQSSFHSYQFILVLRIVTELNYCNSTIFEWLDYFWVQFGHNHTICLIFIKLSSC